ncbi:DUF2970 domain-containing protein [Aliiglaciecola sp. CAU 1673]|uniref:DUF2970 domain-containing protein n=1 Tax=Aliiglaciecola sp. CAU 1673 TaxID=3032595 RepID=UPI0023DB053B|nr:DUF2970 domain-containing protein [Aliiglaciecola sp. CAU 1673]MDF2178673.1 DUF2970 domain-containing protein [Aliiglaciecola sp. CAU 1673]
MKNSRPSWWQVIQSVLASAFGVQSKQKHSADFSANHSFIPYLITGVIFVALFVLSLLLFVRWIVG